MRLAGIGGQGLILAGMILGEAATIFCPLNAVQTQSYAPLARGAPSMSDVVISDEPIDFPMVEQADVLLALAQSAFDVHASSVRQTGTIVMEEAVEGTGIHVLRLPLVRTAVDCGAPPIAASIVGLAVVARLTRLVPDAALREAVRLRVPRDSREANLAALDAGFRLADGAQAPASAASDTGS